MTRLHTIAAPLLLAATSCFIQVVETSTDTGTSGESGETESSSETENGDSGEDGDEHFVCGDEIRSAAEQCDGSDLGDATCMDLDFDSGTLACTPECTYDTSMCEGAPSCGDGMAGLGEECDGEDLNGRSCENLGFAGGQLSCTRECTYDTRACTSE